MTTPTSGTQASPGTPSQDVISRNPVVEGTARITGGMRKQADIRGFTIFCDEGLQVGGDNSAPAPLTYFASSILF